jgi:hypothetical protein
MTAANYNLAYIKTAGMWKNEVQRVKTELHIESVNQVSGLNIKKCNELCNKKKASKVDKKDTKPKMNQKAMPQLK